MLFNRFYIVVSLLLAVILISGCEKSIVELNDSEHFVKFIGGTGELRAINFVELQNENLLILAERVTEKDITLNPFDNPDVGLEDKDYVLIETNKFGNQINNENAPYSAQQIELRKDNQGDVLLFGLANEAFFFIYNWEAKRTLSIVEIPHELFLEINSNSTVKFYPESKKILFNYFKWNNENETEDMVLIVMDFNGEFRKLTFPRKTKVENVYKEWIWNPSDPEIGQCQKGTNIKVCECDQHFRDVGDDRYVSYFEYDQDGQILVLFDSLRYDYYDYVSPYDGRVYETNYKTLLLKKIDLNGRIYNSTKIPSSIYLKTNLLSKENFYLLYAAPVIYTWKRLAKPINNTGKDMGLYMHNEHHLFKIGSELNIFEDLELSLEMVEDINAFGRIKNTTEDELIFIYSNLSLEDTNINLIVLNGAEIKFTFELGTLTQNEYCVDVIRTKSGGYVILANIMLDGHNQMALIRLNEYGELVSN